MKNLQSPILKNLDEQYSGKGNLMKMVNTHEAKTHFSQLINQTLNGEEVVIARRGKALIKLILYIQEFPIRKGGQFKGMMHITDDFDAQIGAKTFE